MEQWVCDGRSIIVDRGVSLIPRGVEAEGFAEDLSNGHRGLLKKRLSAGAGERPQLYAECHCCYRYMTTSGAVADESSGETLEVLLGAGQVTQGFDEALASMCAGEEAIYWLDPAFAFRENGLRSSHGSVMPDEPVQLWLKLVEFYNPMTAAQKIARCRELKESGNTCFNSGNYEQAIQLFHNALRKLGTTLIVPESERATMSALELDELRSVDKHLRVILNTNLAASWFLRGDNDKCLQFCDKALRLDPCHAKALFRKALVLERRLEFDECIALLDTVAASNPGAAHDALVVKQRVEETRRVQTAAQTDVFKKMFSTR